MTNLPLISIIMPCFNSAHFLKYSIESAFKQSFPHIELIVVNDGSTDHSLDILNNIKDPRLVIINQQNMGVCKARNNGITMSKGSFIAFLDADDTWEPECLTKLYQALIKQPEAALTYCGWQNTGLPGGRGSPFIPPDYEQPNKLELLFENCRWPIHAALTRRFAIEEAGFFDDRIVTSEDFLLWLKIASRYPIILVPEVLAYYHHHNGMQATKNTAKMAINHWQVQKNYLSQTPDAIKQLGTDKIQHLTLGELLKRGYESYWRRDLDTARAIFRVIMQNRYGHWNDWKYMLPSLLPYQIHKFLIKKIDSSTP